MKFIALLAVLIAAQAADAGILYCKTRGGLYDLIEIKGNYQNGVFQTIRVALEYPGTNPTQNRLVVGEARHLEGAPTGIQGLIAFDLSQIVPVNVRGIHCNLKLLIPVSVGNQINGNPKMQTQCMNYEARTQPIYCPKGLDFPPRS